MSRNNLGESLSHQALSQSIAVLRVGVRFAIAAIWNMFHNIAELVEVLMQLNAGDKYRPSGWTGRE